MNRDRHYVDVSYTGLTFKLLTDEERTRVGWKVRTLRDRTLLRPDLQDVFDLCVGVLLSHMSGRIDVAAVPRLGRSSTSTGSRRGEGGAVS